MENLLRDLEPIEELAHLRDEKDLRDFLVGAFKKMKVAIWDGDNTLWSWMAYAVPAYEAMRDEIARISGKSSEETAEAMKAFYTTVGTVEHEGLVQGLESAGFFRHMENFDRTDTIIRAKEAFSKVRDERLHVYKGIRTVMEAFRDREIEQIIITDAPMIQAKMRLARSELGKYVSRVYAMPAADVDVPARLRRDYSVNGTTFHELEHEKPDVNLAEILWASSEDIAEELAIFGDNDRKDMQMVRNWACLGVHAAWDLPVPNLVKRISAIAPDRSLSRNMAVTNGVNRPESTGRIVRASDPSVLVQFLS